MSVDVSSAPTSPGDAPRRDPLRRWLTLVVLVGFSAAMVYGTWLAADDMGAKPMAGTVTLEGDALRVVNTSDYAWTDARLVIDGAFTAPVVPGPVAAGAEFRVPVAAFADAGGRAPSSPKEVAIAVTRVPRFPKVNRARTASGTWTLR
ncbi:MAG: hypothetical protein U0P30_04330 [Vicinamibacterales bacterium]